MKSNSRFGMAPLATADDAAKRVLERLDEARGASVIRLGDGEGVLLSRPDLADAVLGPYLTSHFGDQLTQHRVDDLAERLSEAIARADIIGVRPDVQADAYPDDLAGIDRSILLTWARQKLSLREEESTSLDYDSAYRLILLGRWMASMEWPHQALLTSAWVHFDWLESGFLISLARQVGQLGLVTGRTALASAFRNAGIRVDEWPVPLRYTRRSNAWTPHFPDRFEELLATLAPAYPGQLFFVGGGLCGKVYCDVIAQRGGIAIDIGAVCDSWLGICTRPRVARSRWGQDDIPDHLLLTSQLAHRRALS